MCKLHIHWEVLQCEMSTVELSMFVREMRYHHVTLHDNVTYLAVLLVWKCVVNFVCVNESLSDGSQRNECVYT